MLRKTLTLQAYSKCFSILAGRKVPEFKSVISAQLASQPILRDEHSLQKPQLNNARNTQQTRENEEEFLVKLANDPDVFGTPDKEESLDEGDIKENEFFEERALPSQKLSTKKYADLIKDLIQQRKIKEAIDVLEVKMLKEHQFKPENYIYNLLMGACGTVGYTKKAFSLYNNMKKRGLKATPGTYTALFNACANSPWASTDGLTKAKHLRKIMTEKMYEPNETNYNAMIKAFGRCGDLLTAFSIVDEMMSKKIRIKDDTINFLLQACITDKESGFRHALLVWQKMLRFRIKPSLFTYNLMLRSIRDCGLGDIKVTQDVISQLLKNEKLIVEAEPKQLIIRKLEDTLLLSECASNNKLIFDGVGDKLVLSGSLNDFTPTRDTENLSNLENLSPNLMARDPHLGNMICLSEVKKAEDRLLLVGGMGGFLENMKENKCEPNIITFTLLLDVIPSSTAIETKLWSVMKRSTAKFDVDFFNMLIKKRSMRSDYEGAKDVLRTMDKYRKRPNLVTYGILAMGCKSKEEALNLINEMKDAKYRLNAEILGTMLHQACFHKNFPYIIEIMNICKAENVNPNKKFMEHLENFKRTCRRIIKVKGIEEGESRKFRNGFQIFRAHYKSWLSEVKVDDSDEIHPWKQFQENTDNNTDKYYKDKTAGSRFKPRHISKFRVKTSPKHINENRMIS